MTIRKATVDDKEKFKHLLVLFDQETKTFIPSSLTFFEEYNDFDTTIEEAATVYLDKQHITYVAQENDQLIGFITGEIQERKLKKANPIGFIHGWFVTQKYRDQQIGKTLFEKLIEDFKEANCQSLSLETFANNTQAIRMYRDMGFEERAIMFSKKV